MVSPHARGQPPTCAEAQHKAKEGRWKRRWPHGSLAPGFGHDKSHGLARDDTMGGIGELDEHLVRPGPETDDDDGLPARIDEVPGRIVDGDVNMADPWRDVQRALAEHRDDPQILRAVLD